MSTIHDKKWEKIDNETEELILNDIKFIRPTGDKPLSLDCKNCKILISSVEDVEYVKEHNVCESCYNLYYYDFEENKD